MVRPRKVPSASPERPAHEPAIRLRSSRIGCDPPATRLRSSAITLCSIPPNPCGDGSARRSWGCWHFRTPKGKGQKGPHQPITLVNIQQHRRASIPRRCQPGLAARVMDSFAAINRTKIAGKAPRHQRASLRVLGPNLGPMHPGENTATSKINWFASSRHRFAHSARRIEGALWAQRSNCKRSGCARAPAKRKNPSETAPIGASAKQGRWGWVAPETISPPYNRYPFTISRLLFQNSGPACPEKARDQADE